MNPFDVLGIPRGSGHQAIKDAYRTRAKKLHPDADRSNPDLPRLFQELKDAQEAAFRFHDDAHLRKSKDILRDRTKKKAVEIRTVYRTVEIDVASAISGTTIRLEGASGQCAHCAGSGRVATDHPVTCVTCSGTGTLGRQSGSYISIEVACGECDGKGKAMHKPCSHCGGYGIDSTQPAEVILPPNVRDGDGFFVAGAASIPEEDIQGNIELVVAIRDSRYRILGDDIETTLFLDIWNSARGGNATVSLPLGQKVRLSYPAGTQNGHRFVMKEKGMLRIEEFGQGDFVVVAGIRPIVETSPEIDHALSLLETAVSEARRVRRSPQ